MQHRVYCNVLAQCAVASQCERGIVGMVNFNILRPFSFIITILGQYHKAVGMIIGGIVYSYRIFFCSEAGKVSVKIMITWDEKFDDFCVISPGTGTTSL